MTDDRPSANPGPAPDPPPDQSPSPTLPEGPSFGFTFLYYFCGTALVSTLLAVKTLGLGLDTGIPRQYGLALGLVGGTLGALANRSATLTLPISSQKTFKRELDAALGELGYTAAPDSIEGITVYRRPFVQQLLSGRVYVLITAKTAQISTRKVHMGAIKKQLTANGIRV